MKCWMHVVTSTIVTVSLLQGCMSNVKSVHRIESKLAEPAHVQLDLRELDSIDVALEEPGYDGGQLAVAMHQSAYNAAALPGHSPVAGLAGALIGGAIAGNMLASGAQAEKNKPVQNWLQVLEAMQWPSLYLAATQSVLVDATTTLDSKAGQVVGSVLRIKPRLTVVANYMAIELHTLAEIISEQDRKIYSNYFHVQSLPLLKANANLSEINKLDETDAKELVFPMITMTIQLIREDLSRHGYHKAASGIRFSNFMGNYYERGVLLDKQDNYITFRTLRGEIKHYPFSLDGAAE